jgi:hypothetical protein
LRQVVLGAPGVERVVDPVAARAAVLGPVAHGQDIGSTGVVPRRKRRGSGLTAG